jgi:ABC-type Fe3+-hydroxamate transport system substrate-binding protein
MRVVSLVPSVTETLLDWGVEPVAVTRFCEQPGYPTVGGTKDPDVDAIVSLEPDVVVVNVEENRREDADALVARGQTLHVVPMIESLPQVAEVLAALRVRLGLEPVEVPAMPPARSLSRRAFVPIWRRPWMTIGPATYGAAVLAHLGVEVVSPAAAGPYPETTLDEVIALAPALVLAPSEPYPFAERHRDELATVAPVLFVDGKDLFWWGSRTPAAVARLGAQLS